ncbi:DUF4352 domain-containing protein [Streptomyces sp. SID7499]|uniref:DUF4352 domain-containing protein n=1 Tax=Streptomyces sp. SID7499 TaxID=2706086 RepID=A0A6G3XZH2_9ACTN|nr:DUF4352 domain-containing protein [Streptomyces sp. SID7499]
MHSRTAVLTSTAIVFAGALVACGTDTEQGTAERSPTASSAPAQSPDCGSDSTLSQSEWIEQCATATATPSAEQPSTKLPNTELAVGDTFAYKDGVKVKIDSIRKITRFGEYDSGPDAGQIPFRVTFTITNGTDKPYDLDGLSPTAEGGTTGGQTSSLYVSIDSKEMNGRLAPGRAGTFTEEYSIARSDAASIVFSMSRSDKAWLQQNSAWLGVDPHWTGAIK